MRYPSAAQLLSLTGTTTLGFDDLNGVISDPHVIQTSGSGILDRAALAALAEAAFPPMPAEMRGKNWGMTIDVVFSAQ